MGISGRPADAREVEQLSAYKRVIYDGFLQAIEGGVPASTAAILVDQTYGEAILADARERGITTCVPLEKSGQAEFDFEYGEEFRHHLDMAAPTFAKALVRYNPEGDAGVNENQRRRLKVLSDYTHSVGYRFMFELLVPATSSQLEAVGGDTHTYDLRLRPELTVRTMAELQAAEVEPDVWKLEGVEDPKMARDLVTQARAGGRNGVGIVVLGRGEAEERVDTWLTVGARTEGYIGFAVGRTVFWQPLVEYRDRAISRSEAVARITRAYQGFYELFVGARAGASTV